MKLLNSQVIPDYQASRALIELAVSGSMTKTAEKLTTSKSKISRDLKYLENRLGQTLFRREANRLMPTPAGKAFIDYCQKLLTITAEMERHLESLKDEVSGMLYLAMHDGFTRGWLGNLLESFMDSHPKLRLSLRTCYTLPASSELEEIMLWIGQAPENGLRHELLGHLSQGIYASPDYLASHAIEHPHDLLHHEWIDTLGQVNNELVLHHPQQEMLTINVAPSKVQADQLVLQGDAIVRGTGMGFYPNWLAEMRLKAHPGTMERCLPDWSGPKLSVWLMYPFGNLTQRSREFISFLKSNLPASWR
ncbi:MAG: LysR family transcriptional regulator [Methylophaga sp.]